MIDNIQLSDAELKQLHSVFNKHPEIERVILFGSRAKGNAGSHSDIDLAVCGILNDLAIESLALELDDLPLPYKYDVKAEDSIRHKPLREHLNRVGKVIYERE